MTSTVFILGAGASRAAGGPLMVDFLDIAEDMFEGMRQSQEPNSVRDSFELVFREIHKLQEVYARSTLDLNNIESVFATFEMATLLGRLGDLTRQEVQQLAPAMRHLIVCTLEGRIPLKSENDRFTPVPYEEFAKLLLDMIHFANMSVSVITFNYDLALDYALSQHKTLGPVDYGLDLEGGKGRIPVLKLHGSLNWGQYGCGAIVPWQLLDYFQMHPEQNPVGQWPTNNRPWSIRLEIGSRVRECSHCDKPMSTEPMIVPPVWNKTHYHQALATVWRRAAQDLSEAQNIFVIGYSLPESDQFFRYLYALGTVGSTRLRRFWVFDPNASGQVASRYEALLGGMAKDRFSLEPKTFREAIFHLAQALAIPSQNLRVS
jgi:hypothetical protein